MSASNKKSFAIAAFVLSFGVVAAGCGGNEKPSSPESSSPISSPSATSTAVENEDNGSSKLEPYKITMVYPGDAPQDLKEVQAAMSEYLTEKINATIELKPIDWGSWLEKTNLMFASKEKLDIVVSSAT